MSAVLVQTIGLMRRNKIQWVIGMSIEGGYYSGVITISGTRYRQIIEPFGTGRSGGYHGNLRENNTSMTLNDGATNTTILLSKSNWDLKSVVNTWRNSVIGGKNDWYLPSKDELEIVYRNLKPGTGVNDNSAMIPGYYSGYNPSSDPAGTAYTTSYPTQTSVEIFKSGGAQALAFSMSKMYATSSDTLTYVGNSTDYYWTQSFYNGQQGPWYKDNSTQVFTVGCRKVAA